jgi:hypothetical protein
MMRNLRKAAQTHHAALLQIAFFLIATVFFGNSTFALNPSSSQLASAIVRVDEPLDDDGRTCTTTRGGVGDYTTCSDGLKCTTSHGFNGDYMTCSNGVTCTTTHGFSNDYTTCSNGVKCVTANGFTSHTTCTHN